MGSVMIGGLPLFSSSWIFCSHIKIIREQNSKELLNKKYQDTDKYAARLNAHKTKINGFLQIINRLQLPRWLPSKKGNCLKNWQVFLMRENVFLSKEHFNTKKIWMLSDRVTGKHRNTFSKSDIYYCACAHGHWIIGTSRSQREHNLEKQCRKPSKIRP